MDMDVLMHIHRWIRTWENKTKKENETKGILISIHRFHSNPQTAVNI